MKHSAVFTTVVLAVVLVPPVFGDGPVQVPEVSGPAFTIQAGEERKVRRLLNGEENFHTSKLVDEGTLERTFSHGCTTTFSTRDLYAPNLTWNNCSPGPWGTGKAVDMKVKGGLWPLKVGNVVHYQFKTVNAEGQTNTKAFRSCEVQDTVLVEAAGKQYAAYRTHCTEHNGTRTFWYAPAVEATVRMEHHHNKNGLTVTEFIERL